MISTMIFCSITCMVVCGAAMAAIIVVLMSRIANLERRLEGEIAELKEDIVKLERRLEGEIVGIKEDIVKLERELEFDPFAECDPPPDPKHRPNPPNPFDILDMFGHE